ncbi:type II secretion system protein [Methylophilus sp. VKM B-3414]|jgi:MSHA pilin protein MshA|uniref:type II secretion system protein n=1 Tax=unclassified Methylophilus TaxID=2630143 RepID=UPI00188E826B|nr:MULTISPECIES: type II secretion system protein [unclassified Methylophilus]MBF5038883.1 type II secretion system protein [Methylophilus sp. 13]MDT7850122.1 type II secretion system protein [Methylophilus sp. VKM B-3414]
MEIKHRLQPGFTLVEMIVVMLILSALAVTAYARISQVDSQARQASLSAFKANVQATAIMAKGVCMSDPQCDSQQVAPSTTIEGNVIYFSQSYPVGWLGNSDGAGTLNQLLDTGKFAIQPSLSDREHATYYLQGARNSAHCKLEYILTSGANSTQPLTIQTDSSGC